MTANEIVRSWKDEDYRLDYHAGGMAFMPSNPAGVIELSDEELLGIDGGVQVTIHPCGQIVSAAVGLSAGGIASLVVTIAAISIYTYLSS